MLNIDRYVQRGGEIMTCWVNMVGPIFPFPMQQRQCTLCNVTRGVLHVAPNQPCLLSRCLVTPTIMTYYRRSRTELLLACSIGPRSAFVYV